MDKYNRNYRLLIQKQDGTFLQVARPFTVEFDIHRNSLSSANVCQLRVYNLSPNNRNQIRKDQFDISDLRTVSFFAGYGDNLPLAFTGNITQAWSVREGTNMVTQIECFDGGYAYVNAITDLSVPGGTPQTSIIDSLGQSLKAQGITLGAVGDFSGNVSRGNTFSGSTLDVLREFTGNSSFIDNGKVHVLNQNECLAGAGIIISPASGLIGTPLVEQRYINLEMLFEPSVRVAQLVSVQSVTASSGSKGGQIQINGTHKVLGIKHHGVISDAVCGEALTSLQLLPGTFIPVAEVTS